MMPLKHSNPMNLGHGWTLRALIRGTALLIKALNHAGVFTVMSCDGHGVQGTPNLAAKLAGIICGADMCFTKSGLWLAGKIHGHDCKLPDAVRAACEHPEREPCGNFRKTRRLDGCDTVLLGKRPGFDEDLEVSNPVFLLIQSFARELLRPDTSMFLRLKKAALKKDAFWWLENMKPLAPGLEASLESSILYLMNCGKQQELVERLVQLRMRIDLFDSIEWA
jgi:hypothetical protein